MVAWWLVDWECCWSIHSFQYWWWSVYWTSLVKPICDLLVLVMLLVPSRALFLMSRFKMPFVFVFMAIRTEEFAHTLKLIPISDVTSYHHDSLIYLVFICEHTALWWSSSHSLDRWVRLYQALSFIVYHSIDRSHLVDEFDCIKPYHPLSLSLDRWVRLYQALSFIVCDLIDHSVIVCDLIDHSDKSLSISDQIRIKW